MKPIYLIIIGFLLTSSNMKTKDNDSAEQREFYIAVNELLKMKFTDIAVVRLETKPIRKSVSQTIKDLDSLDIILPPPPIDYIVYSKDFFNSLVDNYTLDSVDAFFIYNNIDSTTIYDIDTKNINLPTIRKDKLDSFFISNDAQKGYDSIEEIYGSSGLVTFSTPLFNNVRTKMIISVNYQCGGECGEGHIFILSKQNNNWTIIQDIIKWVS